MAAAKAAALNCCLINLKMSKTSKRLAFVLAALLLVLFGSLFFRNSPKTAPPLASQDEIASAVAQNGEMSKQDYLNYDRINTVVENKGSISDSDLTWILELLTTSGKSDNPYTTGIRHSDATILLHNVKEYSQPQEDKVYHAASKLLSSPNKSDRLGAVVVMKTIKDQRALPALTRLTNDVDPTVQAQAQKAIQAINS